VTHRRRPATTTVAVAGDVGDRQPKKIDWHDYTQIARDEQRTGITTPYVAQCICLLTMDCTVETAL